jgi:hypothetical protein
MMFRAVSAVMCALAFVSAYLQLNDPDPERWFAMYAGVGLCALAFALDRPLPRAALALCIVTFAWAAAIVPELVGRWQPQDLGATMIAARPEIEYGRELGGLSIAGTYCLSAFLMTRRNRKAGSP